jgi:hypothetical protein
LACDCTAADRPPAGPGGIAGIGRYADLRFGA